MKKVFASLVILLSAVLCLSGCEDNKIDDGLEKQVTEKGKEMMQAWVDENMPGAELDEAAAAFLFETLGITPEIKDFSCFVMAPAQTSAALSWRPPRTANRRQRPSTNILTSGSRLM